MIDFRERGIGREGGRDREWEVGEREGKRERQKDLPFHLFMHSLVDSFFLRFYLFIFRERGRVGERKGEKHQCVVASCMPPTRDLAHNPGMCPDCKSNW